MGKKATKQPSSLEALPFHSGEPRFCRWANLPSLGKATREILRTMTWRSPAGAGAQSVKSAVGRGTIWWSEPEMSRIADRKHRKHETAATAPVLVP